MATLGGNFFEKFSDVLSSPEERSASPTSQSPESRQQQPKRKFVRGAGPEGFHDGFQRPQTGQRRPRRRHDVRKDLEAWSAKSNQAFKLPFKIAPDTPRKLGHEMRKRRAPQEELSLAECSTPALSSASSFARLYPMPPNDLDHFPPPLQDQTTLACILPGALRVASPRPCCTWRDNGTPPAELRVAAPRPVTRGTLTLAKMHSTERGHQIWRGPFLDPEMENFHREKSEMAQYRCESAREASQASRTRAQRWRVQRWAKSQAISIVERQVLVPSDIPQLPIESPSEGAKRRPRIIARCITKEEAAAEKQEGEKPMHLRPLRSKVPQVTIYSDRPHSSADSTCADQPSSTTPEPNKNRELKERSLEKAKRSLDKAKRAHGLKSKVRDKHGSSFAKKWEGVSEFEKDALNTAFQRNDTLRKGALDENQLLAAVQDLGLKGRSNRDLQEIRSTVLEAVGVNGEVDLLTFALSVVPEIRSKLCEMFRIHAKTEFEEVIGSELQDDTEISLKSCKIMLESVLGTALMGSEAMEELRDCFQTAAEDHRRAQLVKAAEERRKKSFGEEQQLFPLDCDDYFDMWQAKVEPTEVVAYADFPILLQMTQERYERLQHQHLVKLKLDLGVHEKLIHISGRGSHLDTNILPLHASFRRYDADGNDALDLPELQYVLQEFGFLGGNEAEDEVMMKEVRNVYHNNGGALSFAQFLKVIYVIREKAKDRRREQTIKQFQRFDKDQSGTLNVQEISVLFQDMGLAPTCRQGQDEIKRLLHNCDENHSGELDLPEFHHLVQLVSEKLRSISRFHERELGVQLSFTDQKVHECRDCFWLSDKDGNGQLDIQELRRVMQMMGQVIDGDTLRLLISKLDRDHDNVINFSEFLLLMHALEHFQEVDDLLEIEDYRGTIGRQGSATSSLGASPRPGSSVAARFANCSTLHFNSLIGRS